MSTFQTYCQCLVILSDQSIWLINYFPWKHQNLTAMLKVVKINSTYPQATNSGQSSWNLPDMIFRPSWTNASNSFFKFKTFWPWQPIKFDGEAAKQEVSPFLSNSLTYHSQTCQTGSKPIFQQPFEISWTNLVQRPLTSSGGHSSNWRHLWSRDQRWPLTSRAL